jgi:predicted dehydrogenase
MAEYKGALIGCGFFAVNHMHAWDAMKDVRIVAICDQDPERLSIIGEQFGISRRYRTAQEMLDDGGFDFVDIATTVQSHLPLVTQAAEYALPVICQKPFAASLADASTMVARCQSAGVPLMVHENFRWQSPIQTVSTVIKSGEIGKPFWGRFSFRSAYDVFSGQPYLAKGERFIIEDLGIHTLDIARFLMGEVMSLSARTRRVNPSIRGEDVATMLLDHNDATSIVDCSYATRLSKEPFPETVIEIDGSEGTIRLHQGYQLEIVTPHGSQVMDVSPPILPWASKPWHNIQQSVLSIQQHWVNCLESNEEPETSGSDNLNTLSLVEAAYLSAASGNAVNPQSLLD